MGSLPNLHELEQLERRREKQQEREQREKLREQRARDTSRERERERERLAMFAHRKQASYNAYLMAGLGMGGGTLGMTALTTVAGGAAAPTSHTLSGLAVGGGTAILSFGTMGPLPKHHQHHRHSLTTRHRVLRTRSSGTSHNIWDEQMMEHLAAYSPISTRSHRINPVTPYQVQAALAATRRRESINSSIGATSIRRLLTLNSRNCRHKVPTHVRQKVCRHFTCLTVAHGLMCAVLLPMLGLQGSNSIWHHREHWVHVGPNIGSLLLSTTFLLSAGMCLLAKRLIRTFGYIPLITASYTGLCLFLLFHFYPSIYTLLPAYVLLGLTLSPAWISKIALVVHFSSKLSCSQHECTLTTTHAIDALVDEHKMFCNRDQKVRRLARWFQAAQDLGLILGAVVASVVLACTSSDWNCFDLNTQQGKSAVVTIKPNNAIASEVNSTVPVMPTPVAFNSFYSYSMPNFWPHVSGYFDDFYNHNEHGVRICGADMCPVWRHDLLPEAPASNVTFYAHFINGKGRAGGLSLVGIYLTFSLAALFFTLVPGKIEATFRNERIKGITDTLLFAGPMAYFIGTEQAYMLGDFLRAFVSCSLGISMVAGALIGMGIMQSIVACTLSMLLRHTKRIVIILAGFFFHSCLLLAISRWKPSSDDSALFYVLAASWGACNAMWETLLLALVTLNHTNHVVEVAAPLQGLRFLGLGVTFAAHGFLCETPKILILVIILVLSVPPYALLEIRLEGQRKAQLISL